MGIECDDKVDADMKSEQETRGLIELFTGQLDVDEEGIDTCSRRICFCRRSRICACF